MTDTLAAYAKAFTGAIVACLAVLATSLDNGDINAQEGVYAAIAFFTALGAVWAIPNRDPKGKRQDESVQPAERGASTVAVCALVIGVVLLVLLFAPHIR